MTTSVEHRTPQRADAGQSPRTASLARLLDPDQVVIFDGAMGTMLYSRGVFINRCYDELVLRNPDLVLDVHAAYVRAGAEVLETNTFGANRVKLAQYGLEGQVREINRRAAGLAREAAGEQLLVAGAVGPLGVRLEPFGSTGREEARATFKEQMSALVEGGVDCFLLETFGDLDELEQGVLAAREVDARLPLIAQATIGPDLRTVYGATPEDVARLLDAWGVDVIGLNCSVGPQAILEATERMASVTGRKLSAQPNAGMPRDVSGRRIYMASPEYMASYARHLVQAGAKIVGGCCGTTPEHIRAMVEGIRPLTPRTRVRVGLPREEKLDQGGHGRCEAVPLVERSRLGAKLASGGFVTSVEIVPPRGLDTTRLQQDATRLAAAGVDAVNVPDGPRAQSRMSAIATSLIIQRHGIEAVTHYTCRDRNLLGMLSDLLGAAALGLHNLLLITGDPPKMGPYPDATAVFDVDSIGLANLVSNLNHGLDPGRNPIGEPTRFVIGVGVNPAAIDPTEELRRFHWKVEAGAEYAITQPVFDPGQLERFLDTIQDVRIPVIAGIWPLVSARNAEFLANEVPGVVMPEEVVRRMRDASARSRKHAVAEGMAIAGEALDRVRGAVQGVQVSAPLGQVGYAMEVLSLG